MDAKETKSKPTAARSESKTKKGDKVQTHYCWPKNEKRGKILNAKPKLNISKSG